MKRLLIPFAAALLAAASGTTALSVNQAKTAAAEAQAKAGHDIMAMPTWWPHAQSDLLEPVNDSQQIYQMISLSQKFAQRFPGELYAPAADHFSVAVQFLIHETLIAQVHSHDPFRSLIRCGSLLHGWPLPPRRGVVFSFSQASLLPLRMRGQPTHPICP